MFSTGGAAIFGAAPGHKTSKSSYNTNTSVHTAMTTAMTQSNLSTMMQQRMRERSVRQRTYDPAEEI